MLVLMFNENEQHELYSHLNEGGCKGDGVPVQMECQCSSDLKRKCVMSRELARLMLCGIHSFGSTRHIR